MADRSLEFLGSATYNLSYAFFVLAILGWAYSLTDVSEMAFSFVLIHLNDYVLFKAYYSIVIGLLSLIALFVDSNVLRKIVGYGQMWLVPLGPFVGYWVLGRVNEDNKVKAMRILFIGTSVLLIYVGFIISIAILAMILFDVLQDLPLTMQLVAYLIGFEGIYSLISGILGLITGLSTRVLNRIGRVLSFIMAFSIPFGTALFLVYRELRRI